MTLRVQYEFTSALRPYVPIIYIRKLNFYLRTARQNILSQIKIKTNTPDMLSVEILPRNHRLPNQWSRARARQRVGLHPWLNSAIQTEPESSLSLGGCVRRLRVLWCCYFSQASPGAHPVERNRARLALKLALGIPASGVGKGRSDLLRFVLPC